MSRQLQLQLQCCPHRFSLPFCCVAGLLLQDKQLQFTVESDSCHESLIPANRDVETRKNLSCVSIFWMLGITSDFHCKEAKLTLHFKDSIKTHTQESFEILFRSFWTRSGLRSVSSYFGEGAATWAWPRDPKGWVGEQFGLAAPTPF